MIIGVANDLRYHYWSMIAVFLAAAAFMRAPEKGMVLDGRGRFVLATLAATVLTTVVIQLFLGDARVIYGSSPV